MRAFIFILSSLAASAAVAAPISAKDATQKVRADGYTSVAKTEAAPDGWNVWASKDGVAYEVKVDEATGAVVKAVAVDPDD